MPRQPAFDAEYLEKLRDYYAQNRVFPSYAAIGKLIGLRSRDDRWMKGGLKHGMCR